MSPAWDYHGCYASTFRYSNGFFCFCFSGTVSRFHVASQMLNRARGIEAKIYSGVSLVADLVHAPVEKKWV